MIQSTTIAFLSSAFIYFSVCQGDICQTEKYIKADDNAMVVDCIMKIRD